VVTSSKISAFDEIFTDQFDKCCEFPHLPQNVTEYKTITKELNDYIKEGVKKAECQV
jgi:hypothetical protein